MISVHMYVLINDTVHLSLCLSVFIGSEIFFAQPVISSADCKWISATVTKLVSVIDPKTGKLVVRMRSTWLQLFHQLLSYSFSLSSFSLVSLSLAYVALCKHISLYVCVSVCLSG